MTSAIKSVYLNAKNNDRNIERIHFSIQQTFLGINLRLFFDVQISGPKTNLIEPSPLQMYFTGKFLHEIKGR